MRKTGTRLLAVLAAVSMTVSLFPVNAVTAAQTDKAQSVQAADSLKKASKAPVTFSEASGTYKDAFSLKLQGADTDTDLKLHILGDLVEKDDVVLLVVPVDSAAQIGRAHV